MTERNSLEANAECVLCTPVQTHGAGNSQGEIKCERRAQSSQSWRRGVEEARRFLSLKLSRLEFFFFKKKNPKNTLDQPRSRQSHWSASCVAGSSHCWVWRTQANMMYLWVSRKRVWGLAHFAHIRNGKLKDSALMWAAFTVGLSSLQPLLTVGWFSLVKNNISSKYY